MTGAPGRRQCQFLTQQQHRRGHSVHVSCDDFSNEHSHPRSKTL